MKKKHHNGRRSRRRSKPASPKDSEGQRPVPKSVAPAESGPGESTLPESVAPAEGAKPESGPPESAPPEGVALPEGAESEFDPGMVEHLRMATSLIEGRRVTREEVLQMLRRVMRQHSFAREKRIDYVLRNLKEKSP